MSFEYIHVFIVHSCHATSTTHPSREFFHDRHAISTIATGKCRAGKPEVIGPTTAGAGSSASNTSLSSCPAATAKKRRSAIPRQKA
ncbi:hypothetical protein AB3T43_004818 [Klebsiella variicola]